MRRVLALPLSTVERAGTGDLVSRTTADVDSLARTIRFAIPETLIAAVTTTLTVAAAIWVSPAAALALVAGVPAIVIGTRWYLRRAPQGYLRERAAYATLAGTVGETVDGGLTVESLGLNEDRVRPGRRRPPRGLRAERYTLRLRTFWFPTRGDRLRAAGRRRAALGRLARPRGARLDRRGDRGRALRAAARRPGRPPHLVARRDPGRRRLARPARRDRVGAARPRRLGPHRRDGDALERARRALRVRLRSGRAARDRPRPAAGRARRRRRARPARASRPSAGCSPGSTRPGRARVEVGGVRLVELPLETLRQEVALVTQEQHVFVGTLADNLRLARSERLARRSSRRRSTAVDALEWAEALPEGLETTVGAGGDPLTPPQTQQLALARLVLADPHTLVLDEATSLLDPRAARHLERSLAAVLEGRTVVAIAHRLHTAHDADRVAVVEDGLLGELGTHDELLADGGAYAALWESWRS